MLLETQKQQFAKVTESKYGIAFYKNLNEHIKCSKIICLKNQKLKMYTKTIKLTKISTYV